jgi:hypothetical protein
MILDFVPSVICSCLIFIFSFYQSVVGHHSNPLFCSLQSFLVFVYRFLLLSPLSCCMLCAFVCVSPDLACQSKYCVYSFGYFPGVKSDAGEIPKRIHKIFKTRQKFEIKKVNILLVS